VNPEAAATGSAGCFCPQEAIRHSAGTSSKEVRGIVFLFRNLQASEHRAKGAMISIACQGNP
jgi:hypothetical protein